LFAFILQVSQIVKLHKSQVDVTIF